MSRAQSRAYFALDSDSEKGELDIFLEGTVSSDDSVPRLVAAKWRPSQRLLAVTPWFLAVFFAAVSLLLLVERASGVSSLGSYENGFETDISKTLPTKSLAYLYIGN